VSATLEEVDTSFRLTVLAITASCGFQISTASEPPSDAVVDGLPATCLRAGDTACDGRQRRTCGPDRAWLPTPEVCDFTCAAGACVEASNVASSDIAACGSSAPRLAPTTGTVTITAPAGTVKAICSAGCGDGISEIVATSIGGAPGLAWFCLRSLEIPNGVTIRLPATGGPRAAIAFVVDDHASIAGAIELPGGNASATTAGEGAPGADDGGGPAADGGGTGPSGRGPGGGVGGMADGNPGDYAAGGGGGGGYATIGAGGGSGLTGSGLGTGGAGGAAFGNTSVTPLLGGSGGGAGADGSCGAACGWPGGGGGGALQISSRRSITIAGKLSANGGDGYGLAGNGGGAGGGGAGGSFLFEAPTISLAGPIVVDGGNGGPSGAGAGGAGARGASAPSPGASATGNGQGGSGGGGAGGRVHVRAEAPSCGNVSPVSSCSTATLP